MKVASETNFYLNFKNLYFKDTCKCHSGQLYQNQLLK